MNGTPAPTPLQHGPHIHGDGTVTFRLWAPNADSVTLEMDARNLPMEPGPRGWYHLRVDTPPEASYGFRLDGGPLRPDPASRRQPEGVHAHSRVVDFGAFDRSAASVAFRAQELSAAVVYELHVGTFTPKGTLLAAVEHLPDLADLGVTHVELMPLNGFNGTHGWGYDGVCWWSVHEPYGSPEDLVAFVDACHTAGMAVLLDAVYNHLGPSGNYLPEFGPYRTDRYDTPWGPAMNLDGPGSDEVRGFIVGSAIAWLRDYRIDGLRLDAVHGFVDTSAVHILTALSDAVAALSRQQGRPLQLIAESDRNDPGTVRPVAEHGQGMDAQWADELHHALHTALTGESDGWYRDYRGLPDAATAYRRGFVYDGSRYSVDRQRHVGAPLPPEVPGWRLVGCLQNHDQVGNRAAGDRLTTLVDHARLRAAAVIFVGAPHLPMLFMGDEYGETQPFQYFTSHPEPDLAHAVSEGRRAEFADFAGFAEEEVPDPQDPATVARSTLDRSRRSTTEGEAWFAFWRDLLRVRREQVALRDGPREHIQVHRADAQVFAATRGHPADVDVVVVANLGDVPACVSLPRTNAAALKVLLDAQAERYGGGGQSVAVEVREGSVSVLIEPGGAALLGDT